VFVGLHLEYCIPFRSPHTIQGRCGQTGEGPKEGHEDDQRVGEPVLGGKTDGIRSFLPVENRFQR